MTYCIICGECGEKIVLERYSMHLENCPACGFRIPQDSNKYLDQSPEAEAEQKHIKESICGRAGEAGRDEGVVAEANPKSQSGKKIYVLRAADGYEIEIPEKGGVLGRLGLGAEYFADHCAVSRKHLRIKPYKSEVEMEDLSSFGTWVDGVRQEKNEIFYVRAGTKITLYDAEFTLAVKEV